MIQAKIIQYKPEFADFAENCDTLNQFVNKTRNCPNFNVLRKSPHCYTKGEDREEVTRIIHPSNIKVLQQEAGGREQEVGEKAFSNLSFQFQVIPHLTEICRNLFR